jgi:nucleoside-diphosphate-sugar epimerase
MSEKPLVLITGANGFTGRHACKHFADQGMKVVPVFRDHSSMSSRHYGIVCDLTNESAVTELIVTVQPNYVLHLAGRNAVKESWEEPMNYIKTNVVGTLHLIEGIRKGAPHCRTLVVGSALQYNPAADDSPPHPYSLSKTLQVMISKAWEELLNIDLMIAKPTNLIGPGRSNGICSIIGRKIVDIENAKCSPVIDVNNLQAERDFLDVRDAVEAYRLLLLHGGTGGSYEIGSGVSRSMQETLERYKQCSTKDFAITENKPGKIEKPIKLNLSKIKQLAWTPKIPFSTSLNDILNFYKHLYHPERKNK